MQLSVWQSCCIGRAEETEAHVQEALRLSPRDTFAYMWMLIAGYAKLLLGSDEEAVTRLRRSIEINRNYPNCAFLARCRVGASRSAR